MQIVKPGTKIDFIGKRRTFGIVSIVAVTLSWFLAVGGSMLDLPVGPQYGVDFAGGTQIHLSVAEGLGIEDIRSGLSAIGLSPDNVQEFGGSGQEFQIRVESVNFGAGEFFESAKSKLIEVYGTEKWASFEWNEAESVNMTAIAADAMDLSEVAGHLNALDPAVKVAESKVEHNGFVVSYPGLTDKVKSQLSGALGGDDKFEVKAVEMVGPTVGAELRQNGLLSIFFSLILILVYVSFRFDLSFAPGAVAALFHDVSITIGLFCLFGMEFSLPTVGALLTIIGYSLNDTIVIYDRIRENLRRFPRRDLGELINVSLNETLSRTLLTSVTTMLAVFMLIILGGPIIRGFAIALAIGVGVGTYSSIYVASPMILVLQRWLPVEIRDDSAEIKARSSANYGAQI
jgi:preprotein translocase subunit SecF